MAGLRLRVLTMNVQNDAGDPRRIGLLNEGLRAIGPDVVALQEVSYPGAGSQLSALLEGTGLTGTHQADVMAYVPPFTDRYGGTAVASRWPHQVVEVWDPRAADAADVPWCTLAVKIPLPEEAGELLFIATTASWRLDAAAARERQALAVTDLDARHRGVLPTIIAGDFNAGPDAASIRYLTGAQSLHDRSVAYHDAWAVAGDGPGYTWTADNGAARAEMDQIVRQPGYRRRLDYIFVGSWHAHPRAYCRVEAARLVFTDPVDGLWLSDHFGLLAEVEIGQQE
jgi:endonuclease/exonuclease/phosphatase family metal-dependent hydrolase